MQLWADRSLTMFFVTHDIDEAVLLADHIVVIKGRPGRVSHQFQIDLPRPRVRQDHAFHTWKERVLEALPMACRRVGVRKFRRKGGSRLLHYSLLHAV